MDKTIYYKIYDTTNNDVNILLKISTKGFPIEEKIEYDIDGNWVEEMTINDKNFKNRLEALLEDNNIRLIMDLLEDDDKYYNNKYKIRLSVQRVEKIDNF
ncbi:MAG: hypothetical protein BZ137_06145 [Methanosphaera sp. rholeuAM130]|nr:hypothetical protein [Methanosphaera sp.]RAP53718.1 MAG: hypothetical protein BZ137_06145 [Methanosphaera sp. rholeuAM130]